MGKRAAKKAEKKARNEQMMQDAINEQKAAQAEAAQQAEKKRIFEATRPADEVNKVQFGLDGRGHGSTFSSFDDGASSTATTFEDNAIDPFAGHNYVGTKPPEEKKEEENKYPWGNFLSNSPFFRGLNEFNSVLSKKNPNLPFSFGGFK